MGSVKTNFGHAEGAAGIAGLIKTVLCLHHGEIPQSLHFSRLNPLMGDTVPVTVPVTLMPWPQPGRRVAGVSSFGFSGTNAHVVLEASAALPPRPPQPCRLRLVLVSAATAAAASAQAERLAAGLAGLDDESFADACATLMDGRAQLPFRLAVIAADGAEAAALLRRAQPTRAPDTAAVATGSDLNDLARQFLAGASVRGDGRGRAVLPSVVFQRRRHWFESTPRPVAAGGHPTLGTRLEHPSPLRQFQARLSADAPAFLGDHLVFGRVLAPGSLYIENALAASGGGVVERLEVLAPLVLDRPAVVQTIVAADGAFTIHSRDESGGDWRLHASGKVSAPVGDLGRAPLAEIRSRCDQTVALDALRAGLAAQGIVFGPAFRALRAVWRHGDEAVAEGMAPEASAGMVVDPAWLDACLQTVLALLPPAAAPRMMVRLERLEVAGPVPARAWVHARLLAADAHSARADIEVMDDGGRVVLRAAGLGLQAAAAAPAEGLLYGVEWRESEAAPTTQALLPPHRLDVRVAVAEDGPDHLPALERMATGFMAAALATLGLGIGAWFDATLAVAPQRRLLARIAATLADDGWLRPDGAGWRVAALPDRADAPAVPGPVGELLARCGGALAEVLTGRADPLGLLFPDGDASLVARVYSDSPGAAAMGRGLADAVAALAAALGRPLRVAEIGAGTGSTTRLVRERLGPDSDYLFTDLSPVFTARAAATFPGIRTAPLDIERDPARQGIETGAFDVVIAANVLHATADLAVSLAHARALLAPGELLVLLEVIRPQRWIDLTFGLLDGWWRFTDRPDQPLLDGAGWSAVLERAGFDDPVVVAPDHRGALYRQGIVLARAPARRQHGHWLILADGGGVGADLAERLEADGASCRLLPGRLRHRRRRRRAAAAGRSGASVGPGQRRRGRLRRRPGPGPGRAKPAARPRLRPVAGGTRRRTGRRRSGSGRPGAADGLRRGGRQRASGIAPGLGRSRRGRGRRPARPDRPRPGRRRPGGLARRAAVAAGPGAGGGGGGAGAAARRCVVPGHRGTGRHRPQGRRVAGRQGRAPSGAARPQRRLGRGGGRGRPAAPGRNLRHGGPGRRRRRGPHASAAGRHRAAAGRRVPQRRHLRRPHPAQPRRRPLPPGLRRQAGRQPGAGPPDPRPRPRPFRAVLVGGGAAGTARPGQLRRRQCLPRRPGP